MTMKTNIVRIGNSRGIRLPKSVIDQCRLKDSVELEVKGNALVIRPVRVQRNGWSVAFSGMARYGDDKILDEDIVSATEWDRSEWRW
jgi:antitoxin MazE